MSEKPNRWIINVVLILAVLAFVGFSMIPLLTSAFRTGEDPGGATPSPTGTATPAAQDAELKAQARGYELVLQREPENQTALRGLVDARLKLRDIKGAIEPLEKLTKLNTNESRFGVLLAQAKQYVGDREGAAQAYRTILTAKPGELNALQGLVDLFLEQKRPEAAIGLLQETLKTAPQANQIQAGSVDVISVQILLGRIYATEKRYEEAIAVYDESAKANPQDFRPILAKAMVLKEQGKAEAAKPLFTTAVALAPAQYKDQINQLAGNTPATTPGKAPASPPATNPVAPTPTAPTPTVPTPTATPVPTPSPLPTPN
ncbi:MAG: tetratricopeptide repeat protein [Leptolyngbyaceae bacterium]|nr:tetratricopeptide repeat protein [Leptolyngbyaceae bacterium]